MNKRCGNCSKYNWSKFECVKDGCHRDTVETCEHHEINEESFYETLTYQQVTALYIGATCYCKDCGNLTKVDRVEELLERLQDVFDSTLDVVTLNTQQQYDMSELILLLDIEELVGVVNG